MIDYSKLRSSLKNLEAQYENHVLPTPIEQWFGHVQARIDTTHDYDADKARDTLAQIPNFIDDAIALYRTMSGEPWE